MTNTITLAGAEKAIEAGKAKAAQLGIAFSFVVKDAAAHLVAYSRQDGAVLGGVELSQAKARASVLLGAATKDLAGAAQPGTPMFGVECGFRDRVALVSGAVPLTRAPRRSSRLSENRVGAGIAEWRTRGAAGAAGWAWPKERLGRPAPTVN